MFMPETFTMDCLRQEQDLSGPTTESFIKFAENFRISWVCMKNGPTQVEALLDMLAPLLLQQEKQEGPFTAVLVDYLEEYFTKVLSAKGLMLYGAILGKDEPATALEMAKLLIADKIRPVHAKTLRSWMMASRSAWASWRRRLFSAFTS